MMRRVPKWEILELTFYLDREINNPFTEVSVSAILEYLSGKESRGREIEMDGFYDGKEGGRHVWRIRFAPMWEGEWSYRTRSDEKTLDGITGMFQCMPPVSSGGLTVNPRFPNWFAREDGSFPVIMNEGWYPHPCNGFDREYERRDFPQPGEEDMKIYLQMLADHGVNLGVDIGQLYARQSSVTDIGFRWPWKVVDATNNRFDRERFNLEYYRRTDRMMRFAVEHGIFFVMELLYDNSVVRPDEWSHHPVNRANGGWLQGNEYGTGWGVMFDLDNREHVKYMERYIKYTVARYSAFRNLLWGIGSEIGNLLCVDEEVLPHAAYPVEKAADWYLHWGDYVARKDPHGRLRSLGDTGRLMQMVCGPHNNFNITQDPRSNYYPMGDLEACFRAMNRFGEDFWHYGRPTVVGEMTAGTVGAYDAERRLYWTGFVSGIYMGRADRHFGPVISGELMESRLFGFEGAPVIYEDMKRMSQFLTENRVKFWRMRPDDRLLIGVGDEDMIYCLAADNEEYVVYFVRGGKAGLELPASICRWFNPRNGTYRESLETSPGLHTFTTPDEQDWVLHVVSRYG